MRIAMQRLTYEHAVQTARKAFTFTNHQQAQVLQLLIAEYPEAVAAAIMDLGLDGQDSRELRPIPEPPVADPTDNPATAEEIAWHEPEYAP